MRRVYCRSGRRLPVEGYSIFPKGLAYYQTKPIRYSLGQLGDARVVQDDGIVAKSLITGEDGRQVRLAHFVPRNIQIDKHGFALPVKL